MDKFRRLSAPIAYIVTFGILVLGIQMPAQAAIVGTDAVVSSELHQQNRDRLQQMLGRDDVKQQLLAAGADPAQVVERVNALSDDEVQALTAKVDQMPAGGDGVLGVVVFVFIVLLITDILGFTDIFPFVKKTAR